jgi:hypothetical protein
MIKRNNKTKEQLIAEGKRKAEVDRQIVLAKKIFPFVANFKTIYDAQTVLGALSGLLELEILKRTEEFKVSEFPLEFSKQPKGEITDTMKAIYDGLKDEGAESVSEMLKTMSDKLPQYLAQVHIKDPMDTVPMDKFIA